MHRKFMKLRIAQPQAQYTFTAYGDGYVSINSMRHTRNVVVLPERVIVDWTQAGFEALGVDDFEALAALDSEIILLGTGSQLRFPRPELLQPLIRAQKGLEVMDLQAACRTYNVLAGEGRKVAAALIFA